MQVTAIPIPMETADGFSYYLKKAVTEANEKNPTSDYVKLPEKVGGKGLIFSEKKEDDGLKLVILMSFMVGLYIFYTKQKAKDDEKKWQQELSYDYPKMLSQLSLYIVSAD